MSDITSQSWFPWALGVALGLPVLLLLLTEVGAALRRQRSPFAGLVGILRNYGVPATALLLLITKAWNVPIEETWVRILATVVGFLAIVMVLSALNVVLFQRATGGTWRDRMPTIFVDLLRLVLIVVGLAVVFAWVWGANVGGLFAALGVTSIVLGFALQNAVGSIMSGLLLLFEQPFHLGDWLDTGGTRGRVVEVNWRAVHIDTGNGIQIVPNASLAGASFTNLSEPAGAHAVSVTTAFTATDRPDVVIALLAQVAADIPHRIHDMAPKVAMTAPHTFRTTMMLPSPADTDDASALFLRWVWYAARRAGLHLDGAADPADRAEVERAMDAVGSNLGLSAEERDEMSGDLSVERWALGEMVQRRGSVPGAVLFVLVGTVVLRAHTSDGAIVPVTVLRAGDYLGQSALTRQAVLTDAVAAEETTVLRAPVGVVDRLARRRPDLAQRMSRTIDQRRQQANDALNLDLPTAVGHAPKSSVVTKEPFHG